MPVFTAAGRQLVEHRFDLAPHDVHAARLDAAHARRVLRGDAGDGAGAMHAERGEGLQVGLDARPAAAVRAGDGERHGKQWSFRHAPNLLSVSIRVHLWLY